MWRPSAIMERIAEPGYELSPALQALQQSELITEKNLFPELEYMFKNALTQSVAYNSLLLGRLRELHTQVAAAIEDLKRKDFIALADFPARAARSADFVKTVARTYRKATPFMVFLCAALEVEF